LGLAPGHLLSVTEIGLTQIGVDLRMLSSPRIPRRDSLLENSEVLLICHSSFVSSNERVESLFSIPGQSMVSHRLVGSMRCQLATRRSAKQ
jgi:hypothetical protein